MSNIIGGKRTKDTLTFSFRSTRQWRDDDRRILRWLTERGWYNIERVYNHAAGVTTVTARRSAWQVAS